MINNERVWVYTQHARRVGGHYEMPGSRGSQHVDILLDRDLTPFISESDPKIDLQRMRRFLEDAAQRLFEEGCVTQISHPAGPRWKIVITRADLGNPTGKASNLNF
jgi:hypothetical protein